MIRRAVVSLVAVLAAAVPPASAGGGAAAEAVRPGIARVRLASGERIDLVAPGRILAWGVAMERDRSAAAYLLLDPGAGDADGPGDGAERESSRVRCPSEEATSAYLVRAVLEAGAEFERLAEGLSREARDLILLPAAGDGGPTVLVGTASGIAAVDSGRLVPVLQEDELRWRAAAVRSSGRGLAVSLPGVFRMYVPPSGTGSWEILAQAELPVEVSPAPWGFVLRARSIGPVSRRGEDPVWYAAEPEPFGDRRLRVTLVPVSGRASVVEPVESWCRLPGPEEILESRVVSLGGRPALVVTTRRADKLSLFGEKRLRVWVLDPDRSRSGRAPVLAVESRLNLWQEGRIEVADADGDGIEDLVVGYWKGLKDSRVVLDVYPGGEGGVPLPRPRTTAFDVADADESGLLYGQDLTGDARPDLVVLTGTAVRVYPGSGDGRQGPVVDRRRALEFPLGDLPTYGSTRFVGVGSSGMQAWTEGGLPGVHAIDLEGDGVFELVRSHSGTDERKPGFLQFFRVDPESP